MLNTYRFLVAGLILAITLLSGCASRGAPAQDTEAAYYEAAQSYLDKRNFSLALERLQVLQDRFPFGRYARAAALDTIYAQFESSRYTDALISADRFLRLNPDHEQADYAEYVRAISYYELYLANRGILGKADPAKRSPEQGQKAFQALSRFLQRYPESSHREQALGALVVLKDALARHELYVADYYIRQRAWVAAAERANVVVQHYPGIAAVGDAWVVLIEAYDALNLDTDRAAALSALEAQFPDHPTLSSGSYQAPAFEEDRWWVKALTLGIRS